MLGFGFLRTWEVDQEVWSLGIPFPSDISSNAIYLLLFILVIVICVVLC